MIALKIIILIIAIWIALGLASALWVTRRRRTGDGHHAAGDPFFHPFGDMPNLPDTSTSAVALRRKENGGRSASTSGTAVVLTFPKVQL